MRLDWQNEALQMWKEGIKPRDIAPFLLNHFPKKDFYHVHDSIRKYIESTDEYKALNPKPNKPTGVFGDMHFPFEHENYLQFLIDTFHQYNVGQIVCLGDIVDNHAISRHQTEACAKSAYDELDMSLERVAKYVKAFPVVKVCVGNHDVRVVRQAAEAGIGERYLLPINKLLNLPDTWEMGEQFIIDDVLYKHGQNCGGKDGAINTAIQERMSTCIGHFHSNGGVKYSANSRSIIFGLNSGCGISINKYAFAYGQHAKYRPTLGLGIVHNSGRAEFIPMPLKYFND